MRASYTGQFLKRDARPRRAGGRRHERAPARRGLRGRSGGRSRPRRRRRRRARRRQAAPPGERPAAEGAARLLGGLGDRHAGEHRASPRAWARPSFSVRQNGDRIWVEPIEQAAGRTSRPTRSSSTARTTRRPSGAGTRARSRRSGRKDRKALWIQTRDERTGRPKRSPSSAVDEFKDGGKTWARTDLDRAARANPRVDPGFRKRPAAKPRPTPCSLLDSLQDSDGRVQTVSLSPRDPTTEGTSAVGCAVRSTAFSGWGEGPS